MPGQELVEALKTGGYLKSEAVHHEVGHCYRCHNVVRPYLSINGS